jgi:hypothetical protein
VRGWPGGSRVDNRAHHQVLRRNSEVLSGLSAGLDTSAAFRYFASVCRYLYALDGVFPVSSALLPILILTSVIGLFMLGYRIVIFILNLVRGAGIK